MFIERVEVPILTKANIRINSYNLFINMKYHIECGRVIFDRENNILIFRNLEVLDKQPYLSEQNIIDFLNENVSELVLEYLIDN